MGNCNPLPLPFDDQGQQDDDDDINHGNVPNWPHQEPIQQLQDLYQPPISCISLTNMPRRRQAPPPRSILVVLRMPRVPFVVNRVSGPGGPTISVSCGVVPLSLCNNYEDFMFELRLSFYTSLREPPLGNPSFENPIPGYELWYEMMGPVERRVAFGSHSWEAFKARVRLVILQAL